MAWKIKYKVKTVEEQLQQWIKEATERGILFNPPPTNYITTTTTSTTTNYPNPFVGGNPFDLQTYNYLENAQLANFGTVDNPLVIFTADAPFRYVGCTGPQNEDDY